MAYTVKNIHTLAGSQLRLVGLVRCGERGGRSAALLLGSVVMSIAKSTYRRDWLWDHNWNNLGDSHQGLVDDDPDRLGQGGEAHEVRTAPDRPRPGLVRYPIDIRKSTVAIVIRTDRLLAGSSNTCS